MVDENLFQRVDDLMQQLVGRESHRHGPDVIRLMFNLHNEAHPKTLEYSVGCGGCRERVYKRLKEWWYENGGQLKQ